MFNQEFIELLAHSFLELSYVWLYFLIAGFLWKKFNKTAELMYLFVCVGFLSPILVVVPHIILPWFDSGLLKNWIPFTWALERVLLFTGILTGQIIALTNWKVDKRAAIIMPIVTALLLSITFIADYDWVNQEVDYQIFNLTITVLRPLDAAFLFIIPVLWVINFIPRINKKVPQGFSLFFGLGMLVHALMAFCSLEAMDKYFFAAHILKVVEGFAFYKGCKYAWEWIEVGRDIKGDIIGDLSYERQRDKITIQAV